MASPRGEFEINNAVAVAISAASAAATTTVSHNAAGSGDCGEDR